jgi:ribosomal protein L34E
MGNLPGMGGLARCVACGEVHWNLRFSPSSDAVQECRVCGSELSAEPRRRARRFEKLVPERRDVAQPGGAAGLGPTAAS